MSSPRKKPRMTETNIQVEPQVFLNQARESLVPKQGFLKSWGPTKSWGNLDIDQNIRGIRALLALNQEIWNRCCKELLNTHSRRKSDSMTFTRYGYGTVARCTKEHFCFEPLCKFPARLNPNNMFQTPYWKHDSGVSTKFIDYDLFFENSLSLHDTILKPVLATLKHHLESVQVCLCKIDEWRKARMTETNIEVEPQAFLAQTRESLASKQNFKKLGEHNLDIHQNIRGIRAILALNQEIWNRCCKESTNKYSRRKSDSMTFTRYGYEEVQAYSVNNEELLFTATARCADKRFRLAPLFKLPAELNLFQPPYLKDMCKGVVTKFIDYDLFFENSLGLHDTILKPVLAALKDHLEAVQVCLGKIDEWLMGKHNNIDFLEKTFGSKLVTANIAPGANLKVYARINNISHIYGTHNTTFKISEITQQNQLKTLLDFMSTVEQDYL
jgi:hypothetical protein